MINEVGIFDSEKGPELVGVSKPYLLLHYDGLNKQFLIQRDGMEPYRIPEITLSMMHPRPVVEFDCDQYLRLDSVNVSKSAVVAHVAGLSIEIGNTPVHFIDPERPNFRQLVRMEPGHE